LSASSRMLELTFFLNMLGLVLAPDVETAARQTSIAIWRSQM
jgi:hypothetical protein